MALRKKKWSFGAGCCILLPWSIVLVNLVGPWSIVPGFLRPVLLATQQVSEVARDNDVIQYFPGQGLNTGDTLSSGSATGSEQTTTKSGQCPAISEEKVLRWLGQAELKKVSLSKKRCAVVGSSNFLRGAGRGEEIDGFDVVIRVNRLPNPSEEVDFGRKTDIYFKNTMGHYNKSHVLVQYHAIRGGKQNQWCDLKTGGDACPFRTIVFEGFKDSSASVWRFADTRVPISHQANPLHFYQHHVESIGLYKFPDPVEASLYKSRPSGGMKAWFTAAMLCDSVTTFGFGGKGTIDGHRFGDHNLTLEHELQNKGAAGTLKDSDLPKLVPDYESEAPVFSERLLCLSRHSKLRVT